MQDILICLIGFCLFTIVQSFVINGIFESTRGSVRKDMIKGEVYEGNILYPVKVWLSKRVSDYWMNPICNCVKCMSSLWGGITFWGTIIPLFGFHFIEIWVFVLDVFLLVSLNYLVYKKL